MACCLLRATWAAMTRWRSTTSRQLAHWQSLHLQKRLWPLRHDTTPWFLQRAHFGVRLSFFWSPAPGLFAWVAFSSSSSSSSLQPDSSSPAASVSRLSTSISNSGLESSVMVKESSADASSVSQVFFFFYFDLIFNWLFPKTKKGNNWVNFIHFISR